MYTSRRDVPNKKIAFSSVKGFASAEFLRSFLRATVYECVYVCACMFLRLSHSFTWWSDNNGSWFVYLILWVLEINLRSSGWAASAFILRAILPSHSWASNMTLPMKIVITTAVLQHYWKKKKDTIFLRRISSNSSSSGSRLNHCSSVPSDSGCLEYRVNLELVLCPCLKKDCLDLEEWRVLESTKEQSRCDTQTASGWYRLHSIPAALPFKP